MIINVMLIKKTYTTHNRDPDGTLTLSYMRYDHIFFIIRPMREFHLLQNEMLINVAQNTFPVVKMTFFMALNLVYTEQIHYTYQIEIFNYQNHFVCTFFIIYQVNTYVSFAVMVGVYGLMQKISDLEEEFYT